MGYIALPLVVLIVVTVFVVYGLVEKAEEEERVRRAKEREEYRRALDERRRNAS